jgi:hypothetical protein
MVFGIATILFTVCLGVFLYSGIAALKGVPQNIKYPTLFFLSNICLLLLLSLLSFHYTFLTRLNISAEGIRYNILGGHLFAKWDEIERIDTKWYGIYKI